MDLRCGIYDNDDPNKIPEGFRALDTTMLYTNQVSECYYGFMRKSGNGRRFGIEGYVCFLEDKNVAQVRMILPGFVLKRFNPDTHRIPTQNYLCRKSIFTKHGFDGTFEHPVNVLNQEWPYARLIEPVQEEQVDSRAQ